MEEEEEEEERVSVLVSYPHDGRVYNSESFFQELIHFFLEQGQDFFRFKSSSCDFLKVKWKLLMSVLAFFSSLYPARSTVPKYLLNQVVKAMNKDIYAAHTM